MGTLGHGIGPVVEAEIGFVFNQLAPLGQVGVGVVGLAQLDNGEDVVDVRVHEFLNLLAGGALTTGVAIVLGACAVDVLSQGEGQGEGSSAFSSLKEQGVGHTLLGHQGAEALLDVVLTYDVGKFHIPFDLCCSLVVFSSGPRNKY